MQSFISAPHFSEAVKQLQCKEFLENQKAKVSGKSKESLALSAVITVCRRAQKQIEGGGRCVLKTRNLTYAPVTEHSNNRVELREIFGENWEILFLQIPCPQRY